MKLRLSTKCRILLTPKLYKHSNYADQFLTKLMKHGIFVGFTDEFDNVDSPYRAIIQYHGKTVGVWIANRWYASLSNCAYANYIATEKDGSILALYGDFLWRFARPSRRIELAFWNWLAAHCDSKIEPLAKFMR